MRTSKKYYEVREGDGNQGAYYRATIRAKDIAQAERIARRSVMNLKRYWRRQLEVDGDDKQVSLSLFSQGDNDYSPYIMEIREISKEDAEYNLNQRNY